MSADPEGRETLLKTIKELKQVADNAHKNAQWTMDANRRQVLRIKELEAKITEVNKILEEKLKAYNFEENFNWYSTYDKTDVDRLIKRVKCVLCDITECSTRNDIEDCLKILSQEETKKEKT